MFKSKKILKSSLNLIQIYLYNKKSYISIILFNFIQKFIALLVFSLLAKNISLDFFGIIKYNMITSSILFLPLIGIPSAMLTFASNAHLPYEKGIYYSNSLALFLLLLFLEIIILFFFHIDILLLFFLIQTSIEAFYTSFVSSLGSVKKINLYRTFIVSLQIISILIYFFFSTTINIFILTIILTSPSIISIIILEIYDQHWNYKLSFTKIVVKKIINFAYVATIGSISYTLINSFNVINLKKYYNPNYISYYSSAEMLSSVFIVIPLALNAFLTNKFSQIIDFDIKLKLFLKIILIYIIFACIILFFYNIYGNSIIHLVFGNKMLKSNEILLTMSISSIIIGITLFLSQFYFALLNPQTPAIILTISAILMFFLSNHLVHKYNIVGASISIFFTSLFSLFLYTIFFIKLVINKKIN